ncbi:hypothetical protein GA0070619_1158 [Micromonospora zamorensis]|nr:hypothetical protein GA0070619_1158 [Micromonospora zamorensis]
MVSSVATQIRWSSRLALLVASVENNDEGSPSTTATNLQALTLALRETAFLRLRYIDVSFMSPGDRI